MAVRGGSQAAANYNEPDWEAAVAKEATDMQTRFAEWLEEKAGDEIKDQLKVDLDNSKQSKAFQMGVILGTRFRMTFQASPENQKASAAAAKAKARAADEDDEDEDEAPAPKKGKKAKAAPVEEAPAKKAKKAKKAPVVEDDDEDEDDEPAPVKTKSASKTTKGKRGKAAAF